MFTQEDNKFFVDEFEPLNYSGYVLCLSRLDKAAKEELIKRLKKENIGHIDYDTEWGIMSGNFSLVWITNEDIQIGDNYMDVFGDYEVFTVIDIQYNSITGRFYFKRRESMYGEGSDFDNIRFFIDRDPGDFTLVCEIKIGMNETKVIDMDEEEGKKLLSTLEPIIKELKGKKNNE